jgi:adenylate cyclase class 2
MYEVELKIGADHGRVRDRLDGVGARALGSTVQRDTYYDAPDRDFARTDEALRIRRERRDGDGDVTVRLTYKGPLLETESKSREEHEATVSDAGEVEAILDGLGYSPVATVHKERDRFRVGEYTVTLDAVDGLGEFVEVETETDGDVTGAREGAVDLLETLGLDPEDHVRTSYLGLLLEAGAVDASPGDMPSSNDTS